MTEHTTRFSDDQIRTGVFADRESAERAYAALKSRGYAHDDVNVLMTDETRKRWYPGPVPDSDLGTKSLEGAGVGGAVGGTVGAVLAVLAATATIAVPGVGLVAAGPIAAALVGAGAGSVAGGLLGALVGAGIPEDRATEYADALKRGEMVMGVRPRSAEDAAYFDREWGGSGRSEQTRRLAS